MVEQPFSQVNILFSWRGTRSYLNFLLNYTFFFFFFKSGGQALGNCIQYWDPRVFTCLWKYLSLHYQQRAWALQKDNPLAFSALSLALALVSHRFCFLHRKEVGFDSMVCILYVGHTTIYDVSISSPYHITPKLLHIVPQTVPVASFKKLFISFNSVCVRACVCMYVCAYECSFQSPEMPELLKVELQMVVSWPM